MLEDVHCPQHGITYEKGHQQMLMASVFLNRCGSSLKVG